jgi:hypothetical protein
MTEMTDQRTALLATRHGSANTTSAHEADLLLANGGRGD